MSPNCSCETSFPLRDVAVAFTFHDDDDSNSGLAANVLPPFFWQEAIASPNLRDSDIGHRKTSRLSEILSRDFDTGGVVNSDVDKPSLGPRKRDYRSGMPYSGDYGSGMPYRR
ncbi:hypothetical protein PoB_004396200 [Plakobranchus ocellatus]|uniref:Uncharacterized protein n=1 Tax=Plakobranchus ocellatus TaxID=259542 RepID=A0AAV4BE39_9GAST|nr:hypothetical protein PoB_004396200 [Plakobranchus ocellatus]